MSEYTTTTVENLHALLIAPDNDLNRLQVRLRTASPIFFPLSYIRKGTRFEIALNRCRLLPQGAVYLPVEGERLIDVKNYNIPENLQVHPRGWKDMRLEDLDAPYREERP